ncbi:MAG: rhodanese-like domain-containing protein [Spirochaetales bacterium]|nr:MAG: rhodanese-like domain-containing protein [Spirochaetales bacterium]
MKRTFYAIIVVLLALVGIAACTSQPAKAADYTDPAVLAKLIAGSEPYFLLDVRTPEEYAEGHIPTALNTMLSDMPSNLPAMNKDDVVIVYCRSGSRSGQAAKMLRDMGYTNLFDFLGVSRWTGEVHTGDAP